MAESSTSNIGFEKQIWDALMSTACPNLRSKLSEDVRWVYGTPPAGNAKFAWLRHMIWHLAPNGRIGMVLANGSLSSQSGGVVGTVRQVP